MNTVIPGVILAWDGSMARVRPAMPMQLASGRVLEPPQIVSVPVLFPIADGGRAQVTVPLKPGDDCLLFFSQRSIENWLSGSNQAPDDPRQFDLTDCFACPVLRPTVTRADTDNVNVQYGAGTIKLAPDGSLTIDVPETTHNSPTVTVNASSSVTVNSPVTTFNGDVSVTGHLSYAGGMSGSGGSGDAAEITGSIRATGDIVGGGISLDHHKHGGVEPGGGTTGEPE